MQETRSADIEKMNQFGECNWKNLWVDEKVSCTTQST